MEWYWIIGLCLFAYLYSSLPVGLIIGKAKGVNVRKIGSGNIGGTNVVRALGWKYGFLVAGLDAFKGMFTLFLTLHLFHAPWWVATLVFICSMLGARYSVFLKFKGGKGIAVLIGNLFALLDWWKAVIIIVCYFIVILFFAKRKVSAGSLLLVSSLLLLVIFLPTLLYVSLALPIVAFIIWWAHKDNIKRLIKGEEPSLSKLPSFIEKLPDDPINWINWLIEKLQLLLLKLKALKKRLE